MAKEGFFTKFLKEDIVPSMGKYFKAVLDNEIKGFEKKVQKRVDSHLTRMFLTITMFVGIIFLLIGFAVLVENFISFPKGSGFILVGAIIALTAFIIRTIR